MCLMGADGITVALVGRRLAHNENLGLGYLRAALHEAGFQSTTHYVNDAVEVREAVDALCRQPPSVIGLSLADGGSAIWPLALGEMMHRRGFAGHITSGGQFATLTRTWLLERHGWLDSVVRHAGEAPLADIARRISVGLGVDGVAGVTTRRGDGPPAPLLDDAPDRLVPLRDELPELLGFPIAHILGSRGCKGRCSYCSPAALQGEEWAEGKRGGIPLRVLKERGVGGVRRRAVDDLCDEMATLWHERRVRYFYFVDEHLLPYEEGPALEWLRRFREGLRARGVGAYGIGAMLRADRLTPKICAAFRDAGLVRCFVGLELATSEEGRRFGRRAPGEAELEIVRTLARLGVATVSNLMLVHPYSTPQSIEAGVSLLERLPGGVFEATRMMVYHGTRLHTDMEEAGRLVGNAFRYGYTYEDPAMERFAEIFTRLRGHAFFSYSLAYRTHDTHLALALARRLCPERVDAPAERRLERIRRLVNALYADGYRRGLALALDGGGYHAASALVGEMRDRADALEESLDAIEESLLRTSRRRLTAFAPVRAAAAGVLSFAMLGSGGCYASHARSGGDRDAGAFDAGTRDAAVCTEADGVREMREAGRIVAATDACFGGGIGISEPGAASDASYDPSAFGVAWWNVCRFDEPTRDRIEAVERTVEAAVDRAGLTCAVGFEPVEGGARADMERMAASGDPCFVDPFGASVQVVLDEVGRVVRVDGGDPEIVACLEAALTGLTFPCLASFEVCPEFAIAE